MLCLEIALVLISCLRICGLYNSLDSSTFHRQSSRFSLSYLDKTKLSGHICSDLISFGNYTLIGYFGCINPESQSFYFSSDVSGILGLGFPSIQHPKMNLFSLMTASLSSGSPSPSTSLSLAMGATNSTSYIHKIFTLILFPNSSQGVIQLGGFDPSQVQRWSDLESDDALIDLNHQFTLPILTDCASFTVTKDCPFRNYRVGIHRIRYGKHILFESTKEFEDEVENNPRKSVHEPQLSGVIDSGTTCLIFPSRLGSKKIYSNLYENFIALFSLYSSSELPSLFISFTSILDENISDFSGTNYPEVEIPPSLYTLPYASTGPNSLCIFSIPEYPSLMILGDVFLQAAAVLHNLTSVNHPTLTIFPRQWKNSQTRKESHFDSRSMSLQSSVIGFPIQKSIRQKNTSHWKQERLPLLLTLTSSISIGVQAFENNPFSVNDVPLQEILGIQYIAKIGIGTPLQDGIPVIIDTGSSELVLLTYGLPLSDDFQKSNINLTYSERIIFVVLLLLALFLFILFSFQHKAETNFAEFDSESQENQRNTSASERNGEHELISLIEEKVSSFP